MGCVSSTYLNNPEDEFSQITNPTSSFTHHIVSLTSTTYGLLSTLDPPPTTTMVPPTPPPPPLRSTLGSLFPSPLSEPRSLRYHPLETINSWDLMSSLDSDHLPSFRFPPLPFVPFKKDSLPNDENFSPNLGKDSIFSNGVVPGCDNVSKDENFIDGFEPICSKNVAKGENFSDGLEHICSNVSKDGNLIDGFESICSKNVAKDANFMDGFEAICPPNGENKVVMYTTSLRGVRKTFDDCERVRSAIKSVGIMVNERDVSMDKGFREELRELMKGKGGNEVMIPPRLFVKGRYLGGVDEVMRIVEEGCIGDLCEGLPKLRVGYVCEGCGGGGFLPCFTCHGSCKMVVEVKESSGSSVVVRCGDCNENGLVLCPICS